MNPPLRQPGRAGADVRRVVKQGPVTYASAIDATRDTIVQRARLYKWLVMGVSIAGMAVVVSALALQSVHPLLSGLLLPSMVLVHRALDLRSVHRWRQVVVGGWRDGTLQPDLLARTLRQVPALPALTVEGMLESLPALDRAPPPAVRETFVQAQRRLGDLAEQALAARAAAWALAAAATLAAGVLQQPAWLVVCAIAPGVPVGCSVLTRRGLRCAPAVLLSPWRAQREDRAAAARALAQLNWLGLPEGHRKAWLAALAASSQD